MFLVSFTSVICSGKSRSNFRLFDASSWILWPYTYLTKVEIHLKAFLRSDKFDQIMLKTIFKKIVLCRHCIFQHPRTKNSDRAVVVTQLVEQSLPTPEVRGSNPVIGKLFYRTFIWDENKEKRLEWPVNTKKSDIFHKIILNSFFLDYVSGWLRNNSPWST